MKRWMVSGLIRNRLGAITRNWRIASMLLLVGLSWMRWEWDLNTKSARLYQSIDDSRRRRRRDGGGVERAKGLGRPRRSGLFLDGGLTHKGKWDYCGSELYIPLT